MMTRTFVFFLVLISSTAIANTKIFPILYSLVQFTASVDSYSEICVKSFDSEAAERDLFDMIVLFKEKISLEDEEVYKLRDKYFRIKKSTNSQLTQLGLKRNKGLCKKYLNIFDRFDKKKQLKIDEVIVIIDEQQN